MHKIGTGALAALLALASGNALAQWVKVFENAQLTAYMDSASNRRTGDVAQVWAAIDFKAVQMYDKNTPFQSTKVQLQLDCKNQRERALMSSLHTEKLGKGQELARDTQATKWEPIQPGSMPDALLKAACKAKK